MKLYRIKAVMRTYLIAEIEAEDEQSAWQKAEEIDGGDFEEIPHAGGWDIYDVEELEEVTQ